MHALVFAHEPHLRSIFALVLVELDQVPVIPFGGRHRLVGVVKSRFAERVLVPLDAGDFTGFAAYTGRHIYQLADLELVLHATAWNGADVTRDCSNLKQSFRSHSRSVLLSLLDFHKKAFELRCVSVRIEDRR